MFSGFTADARLGSPPTPRGWFFVAASAGLATRATVVTRVAGADVLVYRGESGRVYATSNACPHLGARLGDGGRVEGEAIECPLHRRRYAVGAARDGADALPALPTCEQNGLVLVWVAPDGAAPDFEVPPVDAAGWTAPVFAAMDLATTAEVVMQDLADEDHFVTIHGYRGVSPLAPFSVDGASIEVGYDIVRRLGTAPVGYDQSVQFRSRAHGLGYQVTEVASFGGAVRSRHFVLPTPRDATTTRVTLGLSVRLGAPRAGEDAPHPVARLLPWFVMRSFVHDVRRDAQAWIARYPVGGRRARAEPSLRAFERWAAQFYPAA